MRRLEFDVGAEVDVGRLRLAGAALVFSMGGLLLWQGSGSIGWVMILVSWAVGLGWTAAFFRSRRRAQRAATHFLEVDEHGLRMARGGEPIELPWADVANIEVDEERLVVWVKRRHGEPLKVDPVWRGVGVHELAQVLTDAAQFS